VKITPIPNDLDLGISTLPRSPGLHLSAIYNDLFQDLEPKRFVRGTTPDPLRLEAGLSLEYALEDAFKRRGIDRPGEFRTPEGIIFTPDLLIYNHGLRVGETKLTWLSSREVPREPSSSFPSKFDKWFTQVKGYCHGLETPFARLYSYFVNGSYRPMVPELLAWDIEFSARELQENWAVIMNHAKHKKMFSA
jgi:hypothetical protein